jgi:hypothetical protein
MATIAEARRAKESIRDNFCALAKGLCHGGVGLAQEKGDFHVVVNLSRKLTKAEEKALEQKAGGVPVETRVISKIEPR